jgi:type I restriction enzyme, S subunit
VTVIASLQPYPKMKDSGLRWLGNIPDHWDVKRGKSLFRCIDVRSPTGEEELLTVSSERGIVPRSSAKVTMFKAESYVGYKLCWPGDLVINSLWAWGRGLGVSRHHGIVSSAYGVYRLRDPYTEYFSYIHELVRSTPFNWELQVRSKGIWISRLQLTDESFLGAPVPPVDEQATIVRFLEYADQRIRRYIRTKQKLIKLLEEQKQAIIHQAVTRGLDPNVQFKDSGVEWLGEIPAHWDVKRVKQISQILRGKFTHRPRNDPSLYDGAYPFIQTGEVARAGKSITSYRQTLNERGLAVSKLFPSGTLVMTIAANIGDVAILNFEACFPDSVVGFVPTEIVQRDYLYYVFRAMRTELLREAPVNTQGNLNVDRIGARELALPPQEEQEIILQYLETKLTGLNKAIDHARREIDILLEYRTRLIADVVTGKLDVRETATRLPNDITDTLEELDATDEELGEETELEEVEA